MKSIHDIAQKYLHVPFSQLQEGDCGKMVYLERRREPFGMFIGKKWVEETEEAEEFCGVYQAIVLHHALRDIEHYYPHHVGQIHACYMLPGNSTTHIA